MGKSGITLKLDIGKNIASSRESMGITMSELARRAGISKGNLSKIELGEVDPTITTLYVIAQVLGASIDRLCEPYLDEEAPFGWLPGRED